tara:strand:- start:7473 stop:7880 length:408 start_codon:yes stop_codon:yes gene_type:complete
MTIGQFALQEKIFSTLNSDSNLTSTQGAAIYDEVPENSAFPYVQIGGESASDFSTKDLTGSEVTINLDVWSQYKGSKEVKDLMDRVHTLLHDSSLAVTGHNLINLRFEFSDVLRDPDGITRHGVMRFRAVMLGTA